jgi:hypothetical protein
MVKVVAIVGLLFAVVTSQSPVSEAQVVIQDGSGKQRVSFQPRIKPFSQGMKPVGTVLLYDKQDVKDSQGQAVTGIAFYGWVDGGSVRLKVFTLVPAAGAENRYWARPGDETDKHVQAKELRSLILVLNKPVVLDFLSELGLKPYTITLKPESKN